MVTGELVFFDSTSKNAGFCAGMLSLFLFVLKDKAGILGPGLGLGGPFPGSCLGLEPPVLEV